MSFYDTSNNRVLPSLAGERCPADITGSCRRSFIFLQTLVSVLKIIIKNPVSFTYIIFLYIRNLELFHELFWDSVSLGRAVQDGC